MIKKLDRKKIRQKKHLRIRKNIKGTSEQPRLAVYRSAKHIYAQLIDDVNGKTLAAASSLEASLRPELKSGGDTKAAKLVGETIGKKALEKGIAGVVFDRGGNIYHGRIKALAEGAREAGLKF